MTAEKAVNIKANKEGILFAPIGDIEIEEGFNIRRNAEPEQPLIDSVKASGVIHPIHVRYKGKMKSKLYLIDGERRLRAAKLAKLGSIPIVNHGLIDDREAFIISLTANDNQKKLTRSEQFAGFRRLKEEGLDADSIARVMAVDKRTVAEALVVLEKAAKAVKVAAQKGLREGGISPRVAARASHLPKKVQEKVAKTLVGASQKEGLEKVRAVEKKLGIVRPGVKAAPPPVPVQVSNYIEPGFEGRLRELAAKAEVGWNASPGQKVMMALRNTVFFLRGKTKMTVEDICQWAGDFG